MSALSKESRSKIHDDLTMPLEVLCNSAIKKASIVKDRVALGKAETESENYPNRWSASIDHRIPLSKGGRHGPNNCQLAHWICNVRKGNHTAARHYATFVRTT